MARLWWAFAAVIVLSFAVLSWIGTRIYQEMPPIPGRVVTDDGTVIIGEEEIAKGQNVWQAMGGMELGSVWGHGSYVAPDWTADWLHRESIFILNRWSNTEYSRAFDLLESEQQAQLKSRLQTLLRKNTFDETTGKLLVEPVRAEAFVENEKYYAALFTNGNISYAIPQGAQS